MLYRVWQPQYAAHGIPTFPVHVSDGVKKPAIRGWQRIGLPASAELAQKFADADAFGFCPGPRSGLTILDVDTNDERVLADALDRHGMTPIIVRTGSGNRQAWYRHNGEKRSIRLQSEKPIDILGSGLVVAPPSHGMKSDYRFIEGSLDDLDQLPALRGLPPKIACQTGTNALPNTALTREGARNNSLWEHCMRNAHHCDDFDALLDKARTRNDEFCPPLDDNEVVKTAKSAWRKTERGENWFGRPRVFFDATQADELIRNDPDLYLMLSFLRANNKPDSQFMATNQGLAKIFHWRTKRVAATRRRMIAQGHASQTRTTRPKQPALYRWSKDGPK
jgi:hypothetical protein